MKGKLKKGVYFCYLPDTDNFRCNGRIWFFDGKEFKTELSDDEYKLGWPDNSNVNDFILDLELSASKLFYIGKL